MEAQQAGQIRSLGVSNYGVHHLEELESYIKDLEEKNGKGKGGEISVGQWELHPWLARSDIVEWCQKRGVVVEAYCPIVRGQRFDEPILQPLVKKYGKTAAQILIRWSLQKVLFNLQMSLHFLFRTLRPLTDGFPGLRTSSQICNSLEDRGECRCLWLRNNTQGDGYFGDWWLRPLFLGSNNESWLSTHRWSLPTHELLFATALQDLEMPCLFTAVQFRHVW